MKTHMTAAEYQAMIAKGEKQSKYRNRRTPYNGVMYDSQKEATRAWELDQMLKAGEITGYERQKVYILPGEIKYKADFLVKYPDGHEEIEDVKSPATRKDKVYVIKKKLMESMGMKIKEV
jgi:hypothetical protein